MQQVNVLLIGDEDRRQAIKDGLRGQRTVRLTGEITESQALPLVPQLQADVIVLDFGATRVNGLAALRLTGAASAASSPIELPMPPLNANSDPVPAQAMHLRKPRRSLSISSSITCPFVEARDA